MTERFRRATHRPPEGSNAQDPGADRLGAYPEAGELDSPQAATERDAAGPTTPQAAGLDAEVIFTGGPGRSLGGPAATGPPRPASDLQPTDGAEQDEEAGSDGGPQRPGPFVDRLR